MGWFVKETSTKFRDEDDRPIPRPIKKSSSRTPVGDELLNSSNVKSRSQIRKERRQYERDLYRKEYQKYKDISIKQRAKRSAKRHRYTPGERLSYSFSNNMNPIGTTFDRGIPGYSTKKKSNKKSNKKRKSSTVKSMKFDPVDNWGFL